MIGCLSGKEINFSSYNENTYLDNKYDIRKYPKELNILFGITPFYKYYERIRFNGWENKNQSIRYSIGYYNDLRTIKSQLDEWNIKYKVKLPIHINSRDGYIITLFFDEKSMNFIDSLFNKELKKFLLTKNLN